MKNVGIYKITNVINGRSYIGQSCNIKRRLGIHRSYLTRGVHDNQRLQRAWNKYGKDAFTFSVIEYVDDETKLTEREQVWIDSIDAAGCGGYNMCPAAGSCKGFKHSEETKAKNRGRSPWNKGISGQYVLGPASEERKKKIGNAQKGNKNHNFGKSTPEYVKDKIRSSLSGTKCHLAKLNDEKVIEIKNALACGAVGSELARKYGVAKTQISAIKNGKTWRHVKVAILPASNKGKTIVDGMKHEWSEIYRDMFKDASVDVVILKLEAVA